jgi:hypothetical protein
MKLSIASTTALAQPIRAKKISSAEVVQGYLQRIAAMPPALNAIVQLRAEAALVEARAADATPAVSRCEQAKALELRVAMSLGRLLQRQGKRAAARMLLAPIYGWFTEGFDIADLREAKVVLEELS